MLEKGSAPLNMNTVYSYARKAGCTGGRSGQFDAKKLFFQCYHAVDVPLERC